MTESDRHIFLYAKGHYQEGNQIEDMKRIIEDRNAISLKYISIGNITSLLIKLAWNYINRETEFYDFISDLHPSNTWKHRRLTSINEYNFDESLIGKCLSVLSFQKIKDIPFELGKPDPNILPLKEKED